MSTKAEARKDETTPPPAFDLERDLIHPASDVVGRLRDALAAILALRKLSAATAVPCGNEPADYFTKQHEDAKAFAARLGPMPPFLEGVVTALAEVIHLNETGSEPTPEWIPVSAMPRAELEKTIAVMKKARANNVVQFPRAAKRRATP